MEAIISRKGENFMCEIIHYGLRIDNLRIDKYEVQDNSVWLYRGDTAIGLRLKDVKLPEGV